MEYEVKKVSNLQFSGIAREFSTENGENFQKIPLFWEEVITSGVNDKMMQETNKCTVGLCYDMDFTTNKFKYMIGVWGAEVSHKDAETVTFDAQTFAIFTSRGALPQALQKTIQQVYSEWFPSSNYEHAGDPEIEVYLDGDASKEDYVCEYWVPVKEKSST